MILVIEVMTYDDQFNYTNDPDVYCSGQKALQLDWDLENVLFGQHI